jgi:hypothetical protein
MLKWFFETYLKEEFEIEEFYLNIPSKESTYLEKCRTIASEIDSVLKQYNLFVKERNIDHELLQISSGHIFMKDVLSQIENKYIYSKGENFNRVTHYLFSNQSMLGYIKKYKSKYHELVNLLLEEDVKKEDFYIYQLKDIEWLEKEGYLYLDENNYLRVAIKKAVLLKQLYDEEVLSRVYVETEFSEEINWLTEKGLIEFESTLFSRIEQDYFNYILNKSSFSNGLDLRNRYVHGTQTRDEREQEAHYYIFLRILTLIVIKMNDEFCIIDNQKG